MSRNFAGAVLACALTLTAAPTLAAGPPPAADAPVAVGRTDSALPAHWNQRAQFMQIYVRSYADSDGDGKGDLKGLISRLDYLKSLGVTGLWLTPIYKSRDHDHGYAVSDYRDIDPDLGTLADFDRLVAEAHARGIGIVLDYVMNHTAEDHPFFQDAVANPASPHRDWFIFRDADPAWRGHHGPSWHPSKTGYYYGVFNGRMPDWNLRNPAVIAWHLDNLRFWLNRGVDGFRFDAATSLIENGPTEWLEQPENHAVLFQAQTALKAYANRYMVCEAPGRPAEYAQPTSCGHAFAFGHQQDVKASATLGAATVGLVTYLTSPNRAAMPLFLSNHDAFAGQRPVAELAGHGEADYRIAAAISLLGSDTPFIYYGEEIGMANSTVEGDNGIRAPMSWTGDPTNAGFTAAAPYKPLAVNVASHNVVAEDRAPGSLLNWYRALLAARSAHPALQSGKLTLLSRAGDSVLLFRRDHADRSEADAIVAINLAASAQAVTVPTELANRRFERIFPDNSGPQSSDAAGKFTLKMPAQSVSIWLAH